MEIIEHVENLNLFLKKSSLFLKKNGLMFVATINRTLKSYVFAIVGAEYILQWLPIGTHDWNRFVRPKELIDITDKNKLKLIKVDGVSFDLLKDKWLITNDKKVNYISYFKKI
jgi:2-polyprenyl-6-hydroxyphenyl methylase/3-demethylubiquinone-9 3-methyltransferase